MGRSRSRSRDRRDKREKNRSRSRRNRSRSRKDSGAKHESGQKEKLDLELRLGRTVRVHGLQKNPEKNGAIGTLGEYNAEKGRWPVDFSSGSTNNFKAENLEIVMETDPTDDMDEKEIPTSKVYITNLASDVKEQDLIDLFGSIGMIAKEPKRGKNGSALGFKDQWPPAVKLYKPGKAGGDGCVEYIDKLAAKTAIRTFNGYRLKGNKIGVVFAGLGKKYDKRELTLPWAEREENQRAFRDHD